MNSHLVRPRPSRIAVVVAALVGLLASVLVGIVAPVPSLAAEETDSGSVDATSGTRYVTLSRTFDQAGPVTVSLGWTGDANLDLFVRDGDQAVVATSATSADVEQLTVGVDAGETLTMTIKATGGTADYTLATEDDPALILGTTDASSQAWSTHEVEVAQDGWISAALSDDADGDLALYLTDAGGAILASSQTTVDTEALSHPVVAGTYLVKVRSITGATPWALDVTTQTGTDVTLVGTSDPAGSKYRAYPITMAQDGLLTAAADVQGDGDLSMWLRTPDGSVLETAKFDGASPERISREVTAGTYEVLVAAEDEPSLFDIAVGQQTGDDRSYIGSIGFDYINDGPRQVYDSFDLDVPADATVAVTLATLAVDQAADLDLFIRRIDVPGNPMVDYSTTSLAPEQATFTTTEAGTYRLFVKATSGASGFQLDADVQSGTDARILGTIGVNNRIYRSYAVQVDEPGLLTGSLDWTGDADLDLYLRDADGTIVDSAAGPGTPTEDLAYEVAPGTWTMTVKSQTGNAPFTLDVALEPADNTAPSIDPIADVTTTAGVELDPAIQPVVTDPDVDDVLTFAASGLPAGLSIAGDTGLISGTPTETGTFDVTVTVDDGTDTAEATFAITVEAAPVVACAPVSTLSCDELQVDLPYALDFDGTEGGLDETGFTLVDEPSDRDAVDQAPAPATPSFPNVPGYEPSLLTVDGGTLTIDATKGIQYATPNPVDGQQTSGTAGINAQLNGLGVAVAGGQDSYELTTSLVAPAFDVPSGGSQQAGLWWFVDEDTYVKLVVARVDNSTNRAQLAVETLDAPTADDPDGFFELNSANFGDGQDVALRMAIDAVSGEVTGFYSVDGAAEVQVSEGGNDSLIVPAALADGVALDDGLDPTVNAGVFATKRSAPATADVSATFADFTVAALANTAPTVEPIADLAIDEDVELAEPIQVEATDAEDDTLTYASNGLPEGLTLDGETGAITGTPTVPGEYPVTVTVNDGNGNETEVSFTITVTEVNDAPVLEDATFAVAEDAAVDTVIATLAATDEETAPEELVYAITAGNDAGDLALDSATGELTVAQPLDFDTTPQYSLTVEVSDGDATGEATITVDVTEVVTGEPCEPVSTLPCDQLTVDTPYSLAFDGAEGGLADTGFTLVDVPSLRDSIDQSPAPATPTFPNVVGFEPSLLTLDGALTIEATKGIQFVQTAAQADAGEANSTDVNTQLNQLGVAVDAGADTYELVTTIVAPDFPGGNNAQQGGLVWFVDEDNYAKLVVSRNGTNENRVQLALESLDAPTADDADGFSEVNVNGVATGEDVTLRMEVDAATGVVRGYYTLAGGTEQQVTDANFDELILPAALVDGQQVEPGADETVNAGLFASKRREAAGTSVTATFTDFSVDAADVNNAPEIDPIADVAVTEGEAIDVIDVAVADADGDDLAVTVDGLPAGVTFDDAASTISGTPDAGTAGSYDVTVTADDATTTTEASFTMTVLDPAADFAANVNFNSETGQQPAGYERDYGLPYGDRGNGLTYGWVEAADGTTPLDLTGGTNGNGRDRGTAQADQRLDSLVHMQADDITADGDTFSGIDVEGVWELAVPDGTYEVTVAAGDPNLNNYTNDPEEHALNVEGSQAVAPFAPVGIAGDDGQHGTGTVTVEVTDGLLTIDADGGTNTKINYVDVIEVVPGANTAPVVDPIADITTTVDEPLTEAIQVVADDADGDVLVYTAAGLPTGLAIDQSFGAIDGTPTEVGAFPVTVTVDDGTDTADVAFTITVEEALVAAPCHALSTLPCADVTVALPFAVDFDGSEGGLADADGDDTGFTMAQVPSNKETQDPAPTVAEVPGYVADQLDVDAGGLTISATNGLAFASLSGGTSTSTNVNSQQNTLGVGFDAAAGPFTVETTVDVDFPGNSNFQQAGLWFGLDEDNYVKVVARETNSADTMAFELLREIDSDVAGSDSIVTATVPEGPVTLTLDVDPADGSLVATYALEGGASGDIATLTGTPQSFFDGVALPDGEGDPATYAGVFASARRASEANRIDATFADFSIDGDTSSGGNTAPEVLLTGDRTLFVNQGTIIPVDTFDEDDDAVTVSVTGLPDGLTWNGTDIAGIVDPAALGGSPFTVEVTGDDGTDATTESFVVDVVDEVAVDVNFQSDGVAVPAGYVKDFGQPYGERTGADQGTGLTYGWVAEGTTDALDMVGNARDRDRTSGPAASDQRLDTLIHMQYGDLGDVYDGTPDCTANQCAEGAWELAVPNGLYEVTLSVGDQPGGDDEYDSLHAINVETGLAILEFQADAGQEYLEVTAQAGVEDGRLTIDAVGGANTKLNYVQVRSLGSQPIATQMIPPNRATGVDVTSAVSVSVSVPGTGVGVDPDRDTSLTDEAVKLFKVTPTGDEEVTGNRGSTGGNDTIAFSPQPALEYDTTYRYVIDGAKDEAGNVFGRFESTFTTAEDDGGTGEPGTFEPVEGVDFEQVLLPEASGSSNGKFIASMQVHDGHLWYTTVGQGMFRHEIQADGTLGPQQDLGVFQGRAAIGLVFDQDDPDLAWVTHATADLGNESARIGSKVSTVDFSDVADPVVQDVFVNLPRSQKDHLSNSIIYGPTGDVGGGDWLYFLQGSNTAAGDTDGAWGARGETQLTAALLRFDPQDALAEVAANGPIDVATEEVGGTYDPFGPDPILEIYATGIRNAYDLVWHSNGHIYVPTNGTAAGGSSPGVTNVGGEWIMQSDDPRDAQTGYDQGTNVTDECATRRADGPYTGGDVPPVTGHPTQYDYLFDVEQDGYYGHPNPTRCEWVLNAGSDSPGSTGNDYPANTDADPNYSGFAYNFDFNKSPNGVIEYQSDTFGGALDGRMMVVRFSNNDDILTMQVDGTGAVLGAQPGSDIGGFSGSYADPLELIEDTSVNPGNIYLNQYNRAGQPQQLYLLRVPDGQQASTIEVEAVQDAVTTDKLIMSATLNNEDPIDTDTVTVSNNGTEPVDVTGTITGPDAGQFSLASVGTIPAGDSVDVDVSFDPSGSSAGVRTATLVFTTGDDTVELDVRALAHQGQEGGEEPTLQQVMDTFEYGLDSGWSGLAGGVDPAPVGDEVDIDLFERASDGPVTMNPIGGFAPFEALPFGWYADTTGAATLNELGVVDNGQQQTLLPTYTSSGLEFDPGTDAFGVYYDSNYFNRVGYTEDARNTDGVSHRARIYPLAGDQFLVAFEDASNGDYQDYMFVLQNVVAAGDSPDPDPDPDPIGETLAFNFQSEDAPVPADHLRDYGQAYAARTGADQGDGLSYGWVDDETFAPLDLTGNGRDRDSNDDQRLDTLMHMDLPPESDGGVLADGSWELGLADGSYEVTVAVGDPDNGSAPESHTINAEGVNLVDGFGKSTAPNGSDQRHTTGTAVVEVSDGRLTIDQVGGTNTKINYLEVTPVGDGGGETVAQVNFQPAASSTPADWEADSGELFSAARGYGWVGTEGGAAKGDDTRDRAADGDPLDGTLIIVDDAQVDAVVDGDWEHALADGTYQVTVSVGDPEYADSTHGVTAEGTSVISGFTPSAAGDYQVGSAVVEVTDGALTLSSSGTNTKLQWVTIASTGGGDVIPPQVAISLDGPGSGGAFTGPVTVSLDITDATLEFVDVFVDGVQDSSINATNFDTPFEVSGTGEHTVEVVATDGAGNETTETAEFTIIETGDGELTLTNPEAAPFDDRLVMSRIQSTNSSPATNETATLVLGNDGSEDLVIAGLEIAGSDFELVDAPSLPLTLGVGDDVTLETLFTGTGSGQNQLLESTLGITHDGTNGPTTTVELAGQWQSQSEGGNEPDVAEIIEAFGFGTTIVGPGQQINNQGRLEAIGDEVLSQTWAQADEGQPITVRQLAAYHTCCNNTATFKWHQVGNKGAQTNVLTHNGQWAQSLLPRINGSSTNPAVATFNPGPAEFSLSIDPESSDWTLNNTSPDECGTGNEGCQLGHHLRIWPSEDRDGVRIPNQWIVVMDYSGINYDFNDNIYLVDNLVPTGAIVPGPPADPTGLAASLEGSAVRLEWDANGEDDLDGYAVERAVDGAAFERITGSLVSAPTYLDTSAPADATIEYRVVAVDRVDEESGPSNVVSIDTPETTGEAVVRINAGGPEVDHQGTTWVADEFFDGGKSYENASAQVPALYQTERSAVANLESFDYAIPVADGTYTVNLHFAEIYFGATDGGPGGAGQRVFSANVEGGDVELVDYDINADVGPENPVVQSYDVEVADGVLDLAFTASVNQPKVSAIEVVAIEIAEPSPDEAIRVNAGGPAVTTGGVDWAASDYLSGGKVFENTTPDIAGTTDDVLYHTEYSTETGEINLDVPLAPGTYELQLHFAEIYHGAPGGGTGGEGSRVFDITVEGALEFDDYDIVADVGSATATVKTFEVEVTDGNLDVELTTEVDQAKLSAFEIIPGGAA